MGTADTFWIDIEDASGNKVGPGPITTAEGWQWSPRLDEAGTVRFRMPASDPAAVHLVEKRVVRCYAMMDGVKTALGAGVIDEVALDVGDPSMLEVSGPDLLAELSQVSVKQLRICEQGWTLLTDGRGAVHRIRTYWDEDEWKHEDAPRYAMFDGDFETHDNILMYRYTYPNIGYLYVGHDARFDKARFTIIDRPNNVATTLHAQYFNGTEWTDLTIADGTESGGVTMAQSGTVEWTRPTDWVRNTPTTTAGDWFWVRFTVGEGTSTLDSFRIEEVEVYADIPTKNGVNLIMQYAPPGWATSGYPATEAAHYIEFDGESILTALGALIEQGGQDGGGNPIREHFRLGSGRTLTWLGTTLTNTGLRAVDADGIGAEGADELCLIQHLSRQRDASGVITRLYPFTADGIDLLLTTRSAPAGYTLVKGAPIPGQPWATASYLQRSSTLGVIEGWARFQDVGMQQGDSYLLHPEMASNALFDRALEYLRTHGAPQAFYDLTVAQVPQIILPGSTIDVVYHEYIDGYHAVDIDTIAAGEPLVILATTLEVDNSGAVTTALEVATVDRQTASDASVIAGSIRELRRIQGTTGGLSSHTTIHREVSGTVAITGGIINGVTIDNSPIGQLAPSTGAFTALSTTSLGVSGNIAVGGTVDGVDVSAHAANAAAHHSLVTVGNTGLSITDQELSLQLADVSGLALSAGLMLDDAIAGAGLGIAAKVLSVALATNSGLQLSGSPAKLHLRAPSTLDATTANEVTDVLGHTHNVTTGSAGGLSASTVNAEGTGAALARADHGHAITAYSDLATYPGQLAKADASGDSTWHRVDLTDRLRAPLIDSAAGQGLTIAPDEDLSLSPGSGVVKATSGVAVGSSNYVSQLTGWRAGYDGGADFRYLYADELHAKSFITDLEQALAGGQIIAKSVAVVAATTVVPAAGAMTTLIVEDLPGAAGQAVFQAGDVVRLRQFTRTAGALTIAACWGVVTNYADMGNGSQAWTFTRSAGAQAGTAVAGSTIAPKTLALDYGTTGNGFYEVSAVDGVWAQNSPYAQVVTWAGHPADGQVVRSRWGNLRGIFAVADDYGLYAAVAGHTDADQYLRISSLGAVLHNLPLELYSAGDKVLALDPTGPSLALGNPIPSGWLTQSGFWAGNDGGTYKQYVGEVSGGALVKGAMWDGTAYRVVGSQVIGPGVGYVVSDAMLYCPWEGRAPYENNYDVETSSVQGARAEARGNAIGVPGKFGKGVRIARGATQLLTNGNFEGTTAGWASAWGDSRLAVTDQARYGNYAMKVTDTTGSGIGVYQDVSGLTVGETYTFAVWVYVPSSWDQWADNDLTVRIHDGTSWSALASSEAVTERDVWVRRTVTTQVTAATTRVAVLASTNASGGSTGKFFYLDGAIFTLSPCAVPFFDATMPGATDAVRSEATLSYADAFRLQPGDDWSLSFWIWSDANYDMPNWTLLFLYNPTDTSDYLQLYWAGGYPDRFRINWRIAGGNNYMSIGSEGVLQLNTWQHVLVTFSASLARLECFIDGTYVWGSVRSRWSIPMTTLRIGRSTSTSVAPYGVVLDDLCLMRRRLGADDARQIYTAGAPLMVTSSPQSLLLTGPGRGKVEGHAGGLFGWDGASQPCWGFCTEDGVSFGAATLNAGDFMIGDPAGGNYLQWDASAGTLTVRGDVAVTGSVSVAWAEITNKPDGAGRLGTGTPGGAGLWLTGSYVGYYNGSAWPVYIANNGRFHFSADANNYVKWDGSTFEVKGRIVITGGSGFGSLSDANLDNVADGTTYGRLRKTIIGAGYVQVGSGTKDSTLNGWHIGSTEIVGQKAGADQVVLDTSGAILAGGGDVRLDGEGIVLTARATLGSGHSGIYWRSGSTTYGSIETTTDALMEQSLAGTSPDWHTIIYSGSPATPRGVVGLSYVSFSGRAAFTVRSGSFASVLEAVTSGTGAGHVLIGGPTDDGVNTLQVNGPSIFGAWMAADRAMVREIAAPAAIAGWLQIFGDSVDGDLKVRFPNGTIKTIQTN